MSVEMIPFAASDASHMISYTELGSAVGKYFKVLQGFMDDVHGGIPTFVVEKGDSLKTGFEKLKSQLDRYQALPVLRPAEDKAQCVLRIFGTRKDRDQGAEKKRKIPLQLILLVATLISVTVAGYFISQAWVEVVHRDRSLPSMLLTTAGYAGSLMAILAVHELGHVIACKRHLIESTLPYFIPAPPILGPNLITPGTFGAVIFQKSSPVNRDELFDLGIAGPLSGFVVALIVTFMGIALSDSVPQSPGEAGIYPPPLVLIFAALFPGGLFPAQFAISLHPIAQAGFLGLIITCLNLFPVSQLDGGHVSRAVFGARWYDKASVLSLLILLFLGFIPPYFFLPFALLLFFFSLGGRHPGPLDDVSKITSGRKLITMMGFVILLLSLPMEYLKIFQFF